MSSETFAIEHSETPAPIVDIPVLREVVQEIVILLRGNRQENEQSHKKKNRPPYSRGAKTPKGKRAPWFRNAKNPKPPKSAR